MVTEYPQFRLSIQLEGGWRADSLDRHVSA